MTWALSDAHRMPYYQGDGSGLIEQLAAIGEQLGWQIELVQMPRTRVEAALQAGQIDAIAISNPKWLAESHHYGFSLPYALQPMRIIGKPVNRIDSYEALASQRVITFAGYRYSQAFEDAPKARRFIIYRPTQGYQMLLAGRADVMVVDGLLFAYQRQQQANLQELVASPLIISVDQMHFALNPRQPGYQRHLAVIEEIITEFDHNAWQARWAVE